MQAPARGFKLAESGLRVDLDRRKRIVVEPKDLSASQEICCFDGIVDAHGERVANGQRGKCQASRLTDQFHVQRQGRVAGIIEITLVRLYDKAARISSIGSIGQTARVDGVDKFRPAEIKPSCATMVQRMSLLDAAISEPDRDFKVGDDGGTCALGNSLSIGHVVGVTVRDENIIRVNLLNIDMASQFVGADEWIEKECAVGNLSGEAGVAVIGNLHNASIVRQVSDRLPG